MLCLSSGPARRGADGSIGANMLQNKPFGITEKAVYPLSLIKLMTRYGEDLVWLNNIRMAKAVFKFVRKIAKGRKDAKDLRQCKYRFFMKQSPFGVEKTRQFVCKYGLFSVCTRETCANLHLIVLDVSIILFLDRFLVG